MPQLRQLDRLVARLKRREGFSGKAYVDTTGNVTVGYGHNLGFLGLGVKFAPVGEISEAVATQILMDDLTRSMQEFRALWSFVDILDEVRQEVLYDMFFNMGAGKFGPTKWPIFFRQVRQGQYGAAADNMMRTRWARQVGDRALELARMMASGKV